MPWKNPDTGSDEIRLLQEALETASGLHAYGVLFKTDMAKIRILCEPPSRYTPERLPEDE